MNLTADDRLGIQELIALHGHLCHAGSYERLEEVFAPDLELDARDLGRQRLPAGDP